MRYKVIFWDFDGVLMNSNAIRDQGFTEVLRAYPAEQVEELLHFHRRNGGLSRYVKFRHFFEEIRKEPIIEEEVQAWADKFSMIMKKILVDPELLIQETLNWVKTNHQGYKMHIVSGSDQNELRYICKNLQIDGYFKSIHGSPTPKLEWVKVLLAKHRYKREVSALIGDSINDFEAARENGITFFGYNNDDLRLCGDDYIEDLTSFFRNYSNG